MSISALGLRVLIGGLCVNLLADSGGTTAPMGMGPARPTPRLIEKKTTELKEGEIKGVSEEKARLLPQQCCPTEHTTDLQTPVIPTSLTSFTRRTSCSRTVVATPATFTSDNHTALLGKKVLPLLVADHVTPIRIPETEISPRALHCNHTVHFEQNRLVCYNTFCVPLFAFTSSLVGSPKTV